MNPFRVTWERREMLYHLVSRELKSRYKGSALGFLWSILTPLFMALIYVFFLRMLAGRGVPMVEIVVGVFAWQFTVQCVQGGLTCISGSANLVKKVYFPRVLLPVSITLANLVNFLLTLVVQFVLIIALRFGDDIMSAWALAVPVMIVYHTFLNLSLVLLVSSSNVYFRDTQHLVGVLLTAWFFLSPVMYNLWFVEQHLAAEWARNVYMLNPVAGIITAYRAMILPDVGFPRDLFTMIGLAWPLLLLVVSYLVFQRAQRNFADML